MKGSALILGCVPRIAVPIADRCIAREFLWMLRRFRKTRARPDLARSANSCESRTQTRLPGTFRLPFAGFLRAVNMKF